MNIDIENIDITGIDIRDINNIILQKMIFIYNALENGWYIKKNNNKYIFLKNHEGKKEVYLDNYLRTFLETNSNIGKIKTIK